MKEMLDLNPKLDGWAEAPKAITLFNLVLAHRPITIVEVGVFGGRSAIPMMMACKLNGRGIVHCIDPWSPEASKEGQVTTVDKDWWGGLNHEIVYQKFLDHVKKAGLEAQCVVYRMKSAEFDPPERIDIFHCDGNHGPDAVEDTLKYASRVPEGGYVILDDCNWHGGYVTKSAEWLKEHDFLELHPLGTGALYRRMK
jgi:predicted O-methyltransferase YrrM